MSVRGLVVAVAFSTMAVVVGAGCYKKSEPPKPATISGTVTVAPELAKDITSKHVLFITAFAADAPTFGPPVASHRMENLTLPVQYTMSQKDVFFEGVTLEGKVNVYAKLDEDGKAGPPEAGDFVGEHKGNPVTVGDTGVDIVVDKVH